MNSRSRSIPPGISVTKFSTLKNSIQTNGGIIQPVIINTLPNGKLVCIEGNNSRRAEDCSPYHRDDFRGGISQIRPLATEPLPGA